MTGHTISHYQILEKIGEGGMGIVYKAEDTKLKRIVALKFLTPALAHTSSQARERFFIEAQAEAALSHANIITVHEIAELQNQVFIVMEYLSGKSLKEKIDEGPLAIDTALTIAIQAAEGLQEAHENEIIHRDIKSANIMLSENERVKIMDFGLARLKGQSDLTSDGSTVGTAAYMSPEQIQGEIVDHRVDIWALGVVLYQMITGHLPFAGDSQQAVIYSILNKEPESVSRLRPDIPAGLEPIINKALTKEPSRRYQDASHLLKDLEALKENPNAGVSLKKFPVFILPVAVVLLAALVSIFIYIKDQVVPSVPESPVKPSLAVVWFENNSGDAGLDIWRSALCELFTIDLSQSKHLRVLRSDEIYGIYKTLNLLNVKRYSSQDLKNISEKGKVNHIIKGSFFKAGSSFIITAVLINSSSGETIISKSAMAQREKDIFGRVDLMTKEIKQKLNLPSAEIALDIDMDLQQITTSYPAALIFYSRGMEYAGQREVRKSIVYFKKAIAIDPGFAMAYRSMADSYAFVGLYKDESKFLEKARELSHRLPVRERYLIMGDYYSTSEKTYGKAIKYYKRFNILYPDDSVGNYNLGLKHYLMGDYDRAIEYYKKNMEPGNRDARLYLKLSEAYLRKQMDAKALEVLKGYQDNFTFNADIQMRIIRVFFKLKQFDRALEEAEKFPQYKKSDGGYWRKYFSLGDLFYYKGDLKKSELYFRKMFLSEEEPASLFSTKRLAALQLLKGKISKAKEIVIKTSKILGERELFYWQATFLKFYAYLFFKDKQYKRALQEFENMWKVSLQEQNHLNVIRTEAKLGKGLTQLELNRPQQALETAEKLKTVIQNHIRKKSSMSLYYFLMGAIEFKRNKTSKAIDYFEKALPIIKPAHDLTPLSRILLIDNLARAYLKYGKPEKAVEMYETIIAMTNKRVEDGDIYAKSFLHLGKIFQKKGLNEKAIGNYKKFITLWKECDPQFQPLIREARKRVKQLERGDET